MQTKCKLKLKHDMILDYTVKSEVRKRDSDAKIGQLFRFDQVVYRGVMQNNMF